MNFVEGENRSEEEEEHAGDEEEKTEEEMDGDDIEGTDHFHHQPLLIEQHSRRVTRQAARLKAKQIARAANSHE